MTKNSYKHDVKNASHGPGGLHYLGHFVLGGGIVMGHKSRPHFPVGANMSKKLERSLYGKKNIKKVLDSKDNKK